LVVAGMYAERPLPPPSPARARGAGTFFLILVSPERREPWHKYSATVPPPPSWLTTP